MKHTTILVIDAQGGGLGRQLILEIKKRFAQAEVLAVGTNAAATAAMLKSGADAAATGENAVAVACRRADFIIGPVGIVIADAMLGEITPAMARAVAQANARRILIPFSNCYNYIAGVSDFSATRLVEDALNELKKQVTEREEL
jgi:hypothetical protein